MKGLKQRLKRPTANSPLAKDSLWTRQDQRVWQAVAGNQPTKVAVKLSKHPDLDVNRICPNVGYSVVHYAAAKGLDDCLNILLAHRADASSCDITGATPLHAAARYGHKGTTTKLLASRSIQVNLADKNACTALHFAAFEGHVECVKLIANVPDVNLDCTDKDGRTPLMVAAAMGRTEVCKELVERECGLHHRDSSLGHTALTLAADSGHADVVRLLYDHGANHTDALHDGRTALQLAKQKDRRSVIDALHVVQLTEAANKSSNGPRLSTSSSKFKTDDPIKKRHSVDCILDTPQSPHTYIDDLVAVSTGSRTPKPTRRNKEEKKPKSNISRVKAAVGAKMKNHSRRGSDASGLSSTSTPRQKKKKDGATGGVSTDNNGLSLYTDGNTNFYEREMKFFDSTSSLDVSSTSSAMNNFSKSLDSLRRTPDELDAVSNGTTGFSQKVEGTDFSRRQSDAEIERLRKQNEGFEQKIRDLEQRLNRATEVSTATEKLQKNAEEVRTAQINAEKEEQERKDAKTEREMQDLKQISVKFERQNKDLLKRVNSAQQTSMTVENLKEQIKKNEESSKALKDENQMLREKVENLEADGKKMVMVLKKEKANESAIITQAKQKIIEAEHRCNEVERKGDEVEQQLEAAVLRADRAEEQCNEFKTKLTEVEQKLTEAEQRGKDSEQKCAQKEDELKEVEQQRDEIEMKLGDVTKNKRKVEKELKKVKELCGKESVQASKYKAELDEITALVQKSGLIAGADNNDSGGIKNVRTDVENLIERLKTEENQLNHTEAKKKDIEVKLNTSIDEKNKKIEDLEKQFKETQDALKKKAAECSRLDSELKHTKVIHQDLENRLTKLDAEKKKMEESFGSELKKTRAELASFQATKMAHADDVSRSRDEVADLRQQLEEALSSLERQREESVPRDAYEADCAKIKKDADILKKEVAKTLEKFALIQLELANREQEMSDLRVERNQSEARSSKYEHEVSQLKSKCHESEVQVNILRQQLTDTKHKLDKAIDEIKNLRKSQRDMTIRLSAKHSEINESEKKKVESLKKQIDNLSSHIQDSEKRYRDTVTIYRGHLLAAATGQLDSDVQQALQEIIKLRGKDDDKIHIPHT